MKTIAITIDENILKRIDLLARQTERAPNRSRFIREAVQDYLTRVERLTEEERERKIVRRNRGRLARQAVALVREQARL